MIDFKVKDQCSGEIHSGKGAIFGVQLAIRMVRELRRRNSHNYQVSNMLDHLIVTMYDIIDELNSLK